MPGQRKNKRARALVDRLMTSGKPGPMPLGSPSPAEVIRYLMDQHGLKRADLVPLLGSAEQVDDILRGRRKLTLTIVQRLRGRFHVPTDLLLPAPPPPRQATKKATTSGSFRNLVVLERSGARGKAADSSVLSFSATCHLRRSTR